MNIIKIHYTEAQIFISTSTQKHILVPLYMIYIYYTHVLYIYLYIHHIWQPITTTCPPHLLPFLFGDLPPVPERSSPFFPKSWRSSRRLRKGVLQRMCGCFMGSSHGCQVLGNEEKLVEYNSHASRCHGMGGKVDGRSLHGENYSAILEWNEIVILLGVTKGCHGVWSCLDSDDAECKDREGGSRATLGFNQSWWILTSLRGIAGTLCFQWSNPHDVEYRVL